MRGLVLRARHHLEHNIKQHRKTMECKGAEYILLAWDRVEYLTIVNTVMNLRVPPNVLNFIPACCHFVKLNVTP